ncbi:Flp pilus assembly complex ATPase component TadA [Oscillochloris sp. ZM17-4]|uniref:ATPase, T2SS/T4P/T4SS family n=1 Tax=Oscillochloris sp. ZM17-4 TaxID=2866714 RepID=UPI001C73171B|nr:ATPase, T2SS/T4P/T4SS family [Oscillochloris sp. ZM17-4]MBX0331136.1 Flp pilus assembly complex ATPase component TadA [Oscillochloris sp. ZM17-4]
MMPAATSSIAIAEKAADVTETLRIYTTSGRIGSFWGLPFAEACIALFDTPDLPLPVWAQIDWYGPVEIWRSPEHEVSDILYNGPPSDPFYVVQRGAMSNTSVTVHPSWIAFVQRQLLLRGQKIDPAGDGTWSRTDAQGVSDKLRYAITCPPLSHDGPSLSIRLLPDRWRTLADLTQANTITTEAATLLLTGLRAGASVIVAGSTGSGKTTLTAGFTQELGASSRLIFVEDGGELPRSANCLRLEVNSQDDDGAFGRAVRLTLRQKPNYVIVGEVRGGEAMAMLQAAATGHPGIGTIHAGSVQGALRNLERMAMLGLASQASGGGQAAAAIVRGLITSASVSLIVVHIGHTPQGRRAVLAIEEVLPTGAQGQSGDNFTTNPLFRYEPAADALERIGVVNAAWGLGRY